MSLFLSVELCGIIDTVCIRLASYECAYLVFIFDILVLESVICF